jgi:hypothetical protein
VTNLAVLHQAAREIYRRLMTAIDPGLTGQADSPCPSFSRRNP